MSGHIYTKISQPADHSLVILKMIPMEVFRLVLEINHDCEPQVADSRCTTYKNQLRGKQREREQASEVGERLVLNRRGTIFHLQAAKSEENCLMPFFIWKPLKKIPTTGKQTAIILRNSFQQPGQQYEEQDLKHDTWQQAKATAG